MKNIKHPIQTYEVRGHISEISNFTEIDVQGKGFSLFVDPNSLDNIEEKKQALEDALSMLNILK